MEGRFRITASGMTMDHVRTMEDRAEQYNQQHGLVVWECPGCRRICKGRKAKAKCRECGRVPMFTEDGDAI
jgi:rubrerythrin